MEGTGGWARWSVHVGDDRCPTCGVRGQVVLPPLGARIGHWLRYGGGAPRQLACRTGHRWDAGIVAVLRRAPGHRLRPVRLVRIVLDHRTAEPVPLFWIGAAALALLAGVAARATLRWRWWVVTASLLSGVWLAFALTALRRDERDDLAVDLLAEFSPVRAQDLARRRLRRRLEALPSPPFEVAGWPGSRRLSGRGWGRGHVSISLAFEAPEASIEVRTSWPARRQPGAPGETVELLVDGSPQRFRILGAGVRWGARGVVGDAVVDVTASGIPPADVVLEAVVDLAPYLPADPREA